MQLFKSNIIANLPPVVGVLHLHAQIQENTIMPSNMCANPTLQQVATVDALMVKPPISLGDLNPTIYLV
jgi:hypothetical protein